MESSHKRNQTSRKQNSQGHSVTQRYVKGGLTNMKGEDQNPEGVRFDDEN